MSHGKIKVELPEIEITVRVGETELAVCSFFRDGADGWDVLVGIDTPLNRDAVALAFESAAEAVRAAAFRPIPTRDIEGGDHTPPF